MAELADARDLKSRGKRFPCRFDPGHRHQKALLTECFFIFPYKNKKTVVKCLVLWYTETARQSLIIDNLGIIILCIIILFLTYLCIIEFVKNASSFMQGVCLIPVYHKTLFGDNRSLRFRATAQVVALFNLCKERKKEACFSKKCKSI